jgi:uncharacterized protein (TIGR02466 family)
MNVDVEYRSVDRVHIEPIFSTPVGYYKFPEGLQEEFKNAIRTAVKKPRAGENNYKKNLYHFYQHAGEHLLEDNPEVEVFKEFDFFLKSAYKDYVMGVCGWNTNPVPFVTDCWVNITKKGGSQVIHSHANSFVSGTYYVSMPEGAAPLVLTHTNLSANRPYIGFDQSDDTVFNATAHIVNCLEGHLVLWPSNIAHYTDTTTCDEPRVSVSMNFTPSVFTAGAYHYRVIRDS